MNDRCRVFALNGEELFPCRWAKAKKLVKANVAERICIDGETCIKMLEQTRMHKPQEAIMDNKFPEKLYKLCHVSGEKNFEIYEFNLTDIKSKYKAEYNDTVIVDIDNINTDSFGMQFPYRLNKEEAGNDGLKFIKELTDKLLYETTYEQKETQVSAEIKQEDSFEFPEKLYLFNDGAMTIDIYIKVKSRLELSDKNQGRYLSKDSHGSEIEFIINKTNISIGDWKDLNPPFRISLSAAIKDFEIFKHVSTERLREQLNYFESITIPKILE